MSNRYLVYTAIFGDYDRLREIPFAFLEPTIFDYVCFSDRQINSLSFDVQIVPVTKPFHLMNRYYKIMIDDLTGQKYKGSIYLDGNVTVQGALSRLLNPDFELIVHDHKRKCVYQEAETIIKKNKDSKENVERWVRHLKENGYKKNQGLYWNGILIRTHNEKLNRLSHEWWELLLKYSYRDQLTLPYLVTKYSINTLCLKRKLTKRGVFNNKYFYYDGKHG